MLGNKNSGSGSDGSDGKDRKPYINDKEFHDEFVKGFIFGKAIMQAMVHRFLNVPAEVLDSLIPILDEAASISLVNLYSAKVLEMLSKDSEKYVEDFANLGEAAELVFQETLGDILNNVDELPEGTLPPELLEKINMLKAKDGTFKGFAGNPEQLKTMILEAQEKGLPVHVGGIDKETLAEISAADPELGELLSKIWDEKTSVSSVPKDSNNSGDFFSGGNVLGRKPK